MSLAFCALLSPAASAGAGGATTGGSTAAATAPSAGTTGTWSGMENEERRTKKIFEDGAAMTGQGKEKRQANDWRTFNEKSIKQAKTGLFIQNLCETEHQGEYERTGIFILESRRNLGRLYEMAPVRIVMNSHALGKCYENPQWETVNSWTSGICACN